MQIEGKDFIVWLHQIREKDKELREKDSVSPVQWLEKKRKEVEVILGQQIQKSKEFLSIK